MATYPGKDGSVSFNATVIGELKSFTLNSEVDIMDDTAMGDDWETKVGGLGRWNGSATCHLDYSDSTQALIIADILVSAPTGDSVAMVFTIATGKTFVGNALVQSIAITGDTGSIVEATFNFVGNGSLTPTWA